MIKRNQLVNDSVLQSMCPAGALPRILFSLALLAGLSPALASVQTAEQETVSADSAEPVAAQRVNVKAIPSVTIEEIVVTSRQSFSSLRAQIDSAEKALYGTYSDLNEIDEYDIECRKSNWAGTFITEQTCWPQFLSELSARNAQDWRMNLGILIPVDHLILLHGDKMDALRANIRRVAGEHPEAAEALLEVGKLQAAVKRKRDACMAQKPVLFVFRLCRS